MKSSVDDVGDEERQEHEDVGEALVDRLSCNPHMSCQQHSGWCILQFADGVYSAPSVTLLLSFGQWVVVLFQFKVPVGTIRIGKRREYNLTRGGMELRG
jgi:hypothetical protein